MTVCRLGIPAFLLRARGDPEVRQRRGNTGSGASISSVTIGLLSDVETTDVSIGGSDGAACAEDTRRMSILADNDAYKLVRRF